MSGEVPLLVPIGVEALVVNESNRRATTWSVSSPNYLSGETLLATDPSLFVRTSDRPRIGVTLHWLLPDALTRGRWQTDGQERVLRYPFICDRWLVVRRLVGGGSPSSRAWVLGSGFAGAKGVGTTPYPDPGGGITYLGRSRPLTEWQPENTAPVLTAVGRLFDVDGKQVYGDHDPAWAASAANVENVLAFHDDLAGIGALTTEQTLSYAVIGWYGDAVAADPMAEEPLAVGRWREVMAALRWSVGDDHELREAQRAAAGTSSDTVEVVPTRTVLHGLVHDVHWTGDREGPAQTFTATATWDGSAIQDRAGWRNPHANDDGASGDFPDVMADMSRRDIARVRPPGEGSAAAGRTPYPQATVGSSMSDALAALLQYLLDHEEGGPDHSDLATLFQALEHDLLDAYETPGGGAELERRLHADGFGPTPGGSYWEVMFGRPEDEGGLATGAPEEPDEPRLAPATVEAIRAIDRLDPAPGVEALLAELNEEEYRREHRWRQLQADRSELYALWWKIARVEAATVAPSAGAPSRTDLADQLNRWIERVSGAESDHGDAEDAVEAAAATLRQVLERADIGSTLDQLLGTTGASLDLVERARPRFYGPADPVVLLSGCRASAKHGGDGRYRADGNLLVRFGRATGADRGQALRYGDGRPSGVEADLLATVEDRLAGSELDYVRLAVTDLLAELAVLTEGAGAPGGSLWRSPTDVEGTEAAVARNEGFAGVRPSPVSVEAWAQPWRPLFLCWQGSWFPVPDRERWELNEGADYEWTGVGRFDHRAAMNVQGRCLLSIAPTKALSDSIDAIYERVADRPPAPDETATDAGLRLDELDRQRQVVEAVKEDLRSLDVAVQTLTGFHDQLSQRAPARHRPSDVGSDVAPLFGDEFDPVAPMPYANGSATSHFYPYRGGHLRLRRLWLVDAFGQVFDVIHQQGLSPSSFAPLRGRGVVTRGLSQRADSQMIQLGPRLIQPSRLRLQFETNDGPPVRGWLLPNHLDNSIMVYDQAGRSLGSVMRWLAGAGTDGVVWRPDPGGDGLAAVADIEDERLRYVVAVIEALDPGGFATFTQALDRTLWSTDALGRRGSSLSALVGRPIAVVSLQCWIELDGPPRADHRWSEAASDPESADRSGWAAALEVPLRLGLPERRDDGTLGYYIGDGTAFHSVLPQLEAESAQVLSSDSSRWPTVPVVGFEAESATPTRLTVLLDPRGTVTASTGVLPVKTFRLPPHVIDGPLAAMDASFRVGPILTAAKVRMPLPADIGRGWSWLEASGVGLAPSSVEVESTTQIASFEQPPTRIGEGWLHLSEAANRPSEQE